MTLFHGLPRRLRYNENGYALDAQTMGVPSKPGPVSDLLGGKELTGRFVFSIPSTQRTALGGASVALLVGRVADNSDPVNTCSR